MYSSHLTFIYELPYGVRTTHHLARAHLTYWMLLFAAAWSTCLSLVIVAVLCLDHSVSSHIKTEYGKKSVGARRCFIFRHCLYRTCEVFCRFLVVSAAWLRHDTKWYTYGYALFL